MVKRLYKSVALVLMVLLVNFVFANTVFIHTHMSATGCPVTHSHPYLPGGHSHTQSSMDQIGSFNLAASAFQGAVSIEAPVAHEERSAITDEAVCPSAVGYTGHAPLRGPPATVA
ncbi:MAG: hypothetical protein K2J17_07870 [Paramuribaculum sp.]|nr:hypothetical protein [Paramuribaculum sp.]MDE6783621.1 hypothetical protein [Paramuribaculum sp.]